MFNLKKKEATTDQDVTETVTLNGKDFALVWREDEQKFTMHSGKANLPESGTQLQMNEGMALLIMAHTIFENEDLKQGFFDLVVQSDKVESQRVQ